MKAIIFEQHGGAEVLKPANLPDPQIKADEALIEVRACALNHLDVWVRNGLPGIKFPSPHILGNDIAGVVREVGELVSWARPGDEVMVQPGVACGHCAECLAGHDNMCDEYDIIGYRRDGGYAELVAVPGVNVIPKPKNLSWAEAAALPLTGRVPARRGASPAARPGARRRRGRPDRDRPLHRRPAVTALQLRPCLRSSIRAFAC